MDFIAQTETLFQQCAGDSCRRGSLSRFFEGTQETGAPGFKQMVRHAQKHEDVAICHLENYYCGGGDFKQS